MSLGVAWPHGEIQEVFPNIHMVIGTNIVEFDGTRFQTSRNMVIIRQGQGLTLVNTVRLNESGLKALEALGQVKHIIRIGAFHGRDDAFYQNRYGAKLWAIPSMELSHGEKLDFDISQIPLPIAHAKAIVFESTRLKEAVLLLEVEGGILISCDSIKNWTHQDAFFDEATFEQMKKSGSIGEALIDQTWLSAMQPKTEELEGILGLNFKHLLSAHGQPLKNTAKSAIKKSILRLK